MHIRLMKKTCFEFRDNSELWTRVPLLASTETIRSMVFYLNCGDTCQDDGSADIMQNPIVRSQSARDALSTEFYHFFIRNGEIPSPRRLSGIFLGEACTPIDNTRWQMKANPKVTLPEEEMRKLVYPICPYLFRQLDLLLCLFEELPDNWMVCYDSILASKGIEILLKCNDTYFAISTSDDPDRPARTKININGRDVPCFEERMSIATASPSEVERIGDFRLFSRQYVIDCINGMRGRFAARTVPAAPVTAHSQHEQPR